MSFIIVINYKILYAIHRFDSVPIWSWMGSVSGYLDYNAETFYFIFYFYWWHFMIDLHLT